MSRGPIEATPQLSDDVLGGLIAGARQGDHRAVARLISLVEDRSPQLRDVAAALVPHTGNAHVIGITGSPGVGKSTMMAAMVGAFRARGERIGVLAVDPSSPFSGGALLGDRVRMQEYATNPDVFIRSMATRGHLGGLAWATPQALRILDAASCHTILVETVGVGQAEVEVASLADTTMLLVAPGMGDAVQAVKAGVLEIADIFVVNKADREGADQAVHDLRGMLTLGGKHSDAGAWRPPIVQAVATQHEGIDDVMAALDKHRDWLVHTGQHDVRRHERVAREIEAIALDTLRDGITKLPGQAAIGQLARRVVEGDLDPFAAAGRLLDDLRHGEQVDGEAIVSRP